MHELVSWIAASGGTPSTIRAAVAHAWLTHIHPFDDGNGRLARVLANLLLVNEELPPVIVKHSSQRGEYLDALAHSDSGGDIMPLTGIFIKSMKRFAREIGTPAYLRRVLRDEIARENSGVFGSWRKSFNNFFARLAGELQLRKITITDVDSIDGEAFGLLNQKDASGSTWLFRLFRDDLELLVWCGYSSDRINSHFSSLVRYPSLYFSIRSESYRLKPYRWAYPGEVGGVEEICVVPEEGNRVYAVIDGRSKFGGTMDSASDIADRISNGFTLRWKRLIANRQTV